MGVNHYVLDRRTQALVVGDVELRVGVLRDIGKANPGTADLIETAQRTWAGRQTPAIVIVPGQADSSTGATALVLGWESGMVATVDYGWSDLPQLGVTAWGEDGRLELRSQATPTVPFSRQQAEEAGILDSSGHPKGWRQPRIVQAQAVPGWLEQHANASSLGVVTDQRHKLLVTLDNGTEREIPLMEGLVPEAVTYAQGSLNGATIEEAADWAVQNARRDRFAEGAEVVCTGRSGLILAAGNAEVEMFPDVSQGRILVNSTLGGAGFAQLPEAAFHDAGDRLASSIGGTISFLPGGVLSFEVPVQYGFSLVLESGSDGEMEVTTKSMQDGKSSLVVPAEVAGPFVADFAMYLAELGGTALAQRRDPSVAEPLPSFGEFLESHGINYRAPGVVWRP